MNLEIGDVQAVMDGEIDPFIEAALLRGIGKTGVCPRGEGVIEPQVSLKRTIRSARAWTKRAARGRRRRPVSDPLSGNAYDAGSPKRSRRTRA